MFFWLFITKSKQDHALPSHVHGKNWSHITQFWFGLFFVSVIFLGLLYNSLVHHVLNKTILNQLTHCVQNHTPL